VLPLFGKIALEILTRNVALARLIREGDTHMLGGTFRRGNGDQTMDDSVLEALRAGYIDTDEARATLRDKKLIPSE
jgi:Tfp pilus assembly pilus retraction ATPase PilT